MERGSEMIVSELKKIEKIWLSISNILSVPHNKKEYLNLCNILDIIIDEVGNNEKHPLSSLMETIGLLVSKYEDEYYKIGNSSGINTLKELMLENNLKQTDLKEIGSQGVVSEILNGKRQLNIRQAKALAEKFNIDPSVFIT